MRHLPAMLKDVPTVLPTWVVYFVAWMVCEAVHFVDA
jgi:hypothetical protein